MRLILSLVVFALVAAVLPSIVEAGCHGRGLLGIRGRMRDRAEYRQQMRAGYSGGYYYYNYSSGGNCQAGSCANLNALN